MASYERQIFEALAGDFNREKFESCACDLLRSVFPGIFPIHGGNDAGQDGGIPDGEGEPYPLVCTTQVSVIGNLTKSLKSYKKDGGTRRKVVVATSQKLEGIKRRNLFKRARREGFEMIGVYDRHWMTESLLRSPDWSWRLLGLKLAPSALSPVPRSNRPHPEIERIGRDADLDWLSSTTDNRLLVGQPGSGKTFLLRCLVREGRALFLVDSDRTAIANALSEERPEIVIVDDAHGDPSVLEMLCHLRAEQDVPTFSILATCWPGQEKQVRAALESLPEEKVHRLELMTRKEILAVLRQLLSGPGQFLQWLVDQAANKPGLAVTLAWLCLRGDWQQVVEGEALRATLMPTLEELVGAEASDFLGVLSLGGDRGMSLDLAGRFLEIGRQKARSLAIGLAAGGVLEERRDENLVVWPENLRAALVRKTFFDRPGALPWRELIGQVPDRDAALREIVRSAGRGAEVQPQDLRQLAASTRDAFVWRGMAAHADHALWALENTPLDINTLAPEALRAAPEAALPMLLTKASEEPEPVNSLPVPALRVLQDWLLEPLDDRRKVLDRRRLAVEHAKRFFGRGGKGSIAVQAAFLALSPEVRGEDIDPLELASITRSGHLTPSQLRELEDLWPKLREMTMEIDAVLWLRLSELLRSWKRLISDERQPDESRGIARAFVERILRDVARSAGESPGLACALRRVAGEVDLDLGLDIDPVFNLLYPEARGAIDEMSAAEERQRAAICDLASEWAAHRAARHIARDLSRYRREARRFLQRRAYSQWPRELCRRLVEHGAVRAETWLAAFLDEEAPVEQLEVFLASTVESQPGGWKSLAERCFAHEAFAGVATVTVLATPDAPADLFALALDRVPRFLSEVSTHVLRGEIPSSALRALLDHPDPVVATESALAEWWAAPRESFRDELRAACHEAILRAAGEDDPNRRLMIGRLGDVLETEPELAFRWIQRRLREVDEATAWTIGEAAALQAVSALREQDRGALLQELRPGPAAYRLLPGLVDHNPRLYRELLDHEYLMEYQLLPLRGLPDEDWVELAALALDHGHSSTEIAEMSFSAQPMRSYGQAYWRQCDDAFASLESHPDTRLHQIAHLGRQKAQSRIEEADASKDADQLYGIGHARERRRQRR